MSSYAVLWSEPSHGLEAGKLELDRDSIRFEGARGTGGGLHRVSLADIGGLRIGYRPADRIQGKPALVLDLVTGGQLRIASVNGVGTVAELADEIARLSATP